MSAAFHVELEGRSAALAGELDLAAVEALMSSLRPLLEEPGDLDIDLSRLTFMDSSGLQALLTIAHDLQGAIRISSPQPAVLRVFEITGTLGRFAFPEGIDST